MNRKNVRRLASRKFRKESGCFLVQGAKNVGELLASDFTVECVYCTDQFLQTESLSSVPHTMVTHDELRKLGTLENNDSALAVARQAPVVSMSEIVGRGRNLLVLDTIRDPGNLGTLVRTADWLGISAIIASQSTVDFYNPKVISATMGSFLRVSVSYLELTNACAALQEHQFTLIGATTTGSPLHDLVVRSPFALILGSESHGLSQPIQDLLDEEVTIPRIGQAESLNVSVAGGIILYKLLDQR